METEHPEQQGVIFKRSPVVIVRDVILLDALGALLFILASYLAHYARIYRSIFVAHYISFEIAELAGLFLFETAILLFVFVRWYKEYYRIRPGGLVHRTGIFSRHEKVIPLDEIVSVSSRQGFVGRRIKHGTLELQSRAVGEAIRITYVPEPERYRELILKAKKGSMVFPESFTATDDAQLFAQGEHEGMEFKSTLRWDVRAGKVNRNMEKGVMKTVAAFMNSRGGTLLLGVDDTRNVIGLDADFATLSKQNADSFENHFSNLFHEMIGPNFRQYIKFQWRENQGKAFCAVHVAPSPLPAYLKFDGTEEFYVRAGNASIALKLSDVTSYINTRFRSA